jgi:RNA polymerase sigma factor (sigma-70 family)
MDSLRGSGATAVIVQLERLFRYGTVTGSTETELLERFVTHRDEAAFEAIIARYGPMVLHVCRQSLRDPNDVDDAFQATFLVLVRKAGSLKRCELLGNWLYGVAHRVAVRARSHAARRQAKAAAVAEMARAKAGQLFAHEAEIDQLSLKSSQEEPWLHEEIARLPEKYRAPIVLCYLEGLTHDDAARRLEWPLGTVKGRLARARELLRKRLTRRGFVISEAAFAKALCGPDAKAAVPAALVQSTLRAATSISSRAGLSLVAATKISPPVAGLGEGVLKAMTMTQVKAFALPLLLLGTVTTGVVALAAAAYPQNKKGDAQPEPAGPAVQRQAAAGAVPAPVPAPESGPRTADEVLRNQVNADAELYENLIVPGRTLSERDFRSLIRWSLSLLDASRSIGGGPEAQKTAYAAHRDRMKRLNALAANSALPEEIKEITQVQLKDAEELLESAPKERPFPLAPGPAAEAARDQPASDGPNRHEPSAPADVSRNDTVKAQTRRQATTEATRITTARRGQAATGASAPRGKAAVAGGGFGAMGGRAGPAARTMLLRSNAAIAAEMAIRNPDPRNAVIRKKLEEPISMSFAFETPLDDVLKYIKQATTTPTYAGLPIYVDPNGLKETGSSLLSTVSLDLEGIPLKTTLRLALKQLGLAYCVRDGVLIISSVEGIREELLEEQSESEAANPSKEAGIQ